MASKPDVEMNPSTVVSHESVLQTLLSHVQQNIASPPDALAKSLHEQASQNANAKSLLSTTLHQALISCLPQSSAPQQDPYSKAILIVKVSTSLLANSLHAEYKLPLDLLHTLLTRTPTPNLQALLPHVRETLGEYCKLPLPKNSIYFLIKLVRACIDRDIGCLNRVLGGRLRLLLAGSLDVWHASGLNVRGVYNEHAAITVSPSNTDVALCKAFANGMSLARRASLGESPAGWTAGRNGVETVLQAFETLSSTPAKNGGSGIVGDYLTDGRVLRLQFEDPVFRRCVLTQYAFMLQHLEMQATYPTVPPAERASVEFCKSLFVSGGEGDVLRQRTWRVLHDSRYKKFLQGLLVRERKWQEWKKRNTYKHLLGRKIIPEARFKRRGANGKKRVGGGWRERMASWSGGDGLEALRERVPGVKVEQVLKEVKEDLDEGVEVGERRVDDAKFVWRGLRVLCEGNLMGVGGLGGSGSLDSLVKTTKT